MKKTEFLITREGESTQAIVSLETADGITANDAMQKICECVADWIDNTKDGQDAWDESGEDFNIGDLSGYCDNSDLVIIFMNAGLYRVEVSANEIELLDNFTYDTVLPRRSRSFKG